MEITMKKITNKLESLKVDIRKDEEIIEKFKKENEQDLKTVKSEYNELVKMYAKVENSDQISYEMVQKIIEEFKFLVNEYKSISCILHCCSVLKGDDEKQHKQNRKTMEARDVILCSLRKKMEVWETQRSGKMGDKIKQESAIERRIEEKRKTLAQIENDMIEEMMNIAQKEKKLQELARELKRIETSKQKAIAKVETKSKMRIDCLKAAQSHLDLITCQNIAKQEKQDNLKLGYEEINQLKDGVANSELKCKEIEKMIQNLSETIQNKSKQLAIVKEQAQINKQENEMKLAEFDKRENKLDEKIFYLELACSETEAKIENLNNVIAEKCKQIASIEEEIHRKTFRFESLKEAKLLEDSEDNEDEDLDDEIEEFKEKIEIIKKSTSK